MRSWLSLAAMFVVVAALAAWAYFRADAPPAEAHALTQLTASNVTRIRLERTGPEPAASAASSSPTAPAEPLHGAVSVELERSGEEWRMISPVPARADTFQVDRLLAILDARSLARFPANDLGRYGLDKPHARLTLNDETFSYGGVNTATREQYVLARDGVYAIPLAQRTTLPRDADALVSRSLFAAGETPSRIELPDFTAVLEEGRWVFSPVSEEPGPDERNGWVAAWRQATAARAGRHDGRAGQATIVVGLQDGRTIQLGIIAREPELVLLRSDEGIQYHFLADIAKRLLALPGTRGETASK